MGRRCCVPGCNSTSRLVEHRGVTYHTFPLDPVIRSIWLKNAKCPPDKQITKSVLVCSRHFRRIDFNTIKNGKYLLKQRVFPTVFPWGRVDNNEVLIDQELIKNSAGQIPPALASPNSTNDDSTASTDKVAATVAQILAETAELNALAGIKNESEKKQLADKGNDDSNEMSAHTTASDLAQGLDTATASPSGYRYEPLTVFNPGSRVEAQDFEGIWHLARVVEVDHDDREVLIRFERNGRMKTTSSLAGTEEWIPMNSNRLRQKVSTKPIPSFDLEEKCLARWSGSRKFPATVKKILGNDTYEVLFDDGFTKSVRALHMTKISEVKKPNVLDSSTDGSTTPTQPQSSINTFTPLKAAANEATSSSANTKKRTSPGSRKDWPLLDLNKIDIDSLNLPDIPQDGEWTCHWVNDQPIGKEGYLLVGEHRKPTVVVEDWRLPPGWVKHMYQRSNVLGKWDVILVSPSGKRFRSKSDLKTYLEEKGQVYNPDIYDFSIHRRRAKDINAYAYTDDYTPPQPGGKQNALDTSLDMSLDEKAAVASSLEKKVLSKSNSQYLETPIASATPPMELMTSPTIEKMQALPTDQLLTETNPKPTESSSGKSTPSVEQQPAAANTLPPLEDGYVYIGGLKIQMVDNLFRCPDESCSKQFRKENHLQIHVKHYHRELAKSLGSCPKMLELAAKRTHTISHEISEPTPKNQIPNQQFFAKLHQQDIEQSRSHKRNLTSTTPATPMPITTTTRNDGEKSIISCIISNASPKHKEQTAAKTPTEATKILDIITTSAKSKAGEDSKTKTSNANVVSAETPLKTTTTSPRKPMEATPNDSKVSSSLDQTMDSTAEETTLNESASPGLSRDKSFSSMRHRFGSSLRKDSGSRRSNRQRVTRRFLTAAEAQLTASNANKAATKPQQPTEAASSINDAVLSPTNEQKKRSRNRTRHVRPAQSQSQTPTTAPSTPLSSTESPITADSMELPEFSTTIKSLNETGSGETVKLEKMKKTEIINCLCNYGEEDGLMIQCELCLCWQHGACNGIEKEEEVPDPYFCYICRHPNKAREKMRFIHDQYWLYEGKLPTANYHSTSENLEKRFELLKQSHRITGNLVNLRSFMHTLNGKINIGLNRSHPKLYLWATDWDPKPIRDEKPDLEKIKVEKDEQKEGGGRSAKKEEAKGRKTNIKSEPEDDPDEPDSKKIKIEAEDSFPNAPQPEAAIDPEECQQRLHKHVRYQQQLIADRLDEFEKEISALEEADNLKDSKDDDSTSTKELLTAYIRDLGILRKIARLNRIKHEQKLLQQQIPTAQTLAPTSTNNNGTLSAYTQMTAQPSLQTLVN